MQMKKRLIEEKASMAVYVSMVLLGFMIILSGIYFSSGSVRRSQLSTTLKIKEAYETNNPYIEETYQTQYAKWVPAATITVSTTATLTGDDVTITVAQENERNLDFTNCKYVYNTSSTAIGTNVSSYTGGNLSSTNNTLTFSETTEGTYYLHVLTTNEDGKSVETISAGIDVVSGETTSYASANTTSSPYSTFTAPANGTYKLQVWGAQGGSYNTSYATGGLGGYSVGEITLSKGTKLYVYVGGAGSYGTTTTYTTTTGGGYNGGGAAAYRGGTGGGATDIRLTSGDWNNSASLHSRVIVAGGGGGAYSYSSTYKAAGGYAGGTQAGSGSYYSSTYSAWVGGGASTTAGGTAGTGSSTNYYGKVGSFGIGASTGYKYNSTSYYSNGAGGGGWYGGGSAGNYSSAARTRAAGGGGGSGFVWTSANASNVPSDYSVGTAYYLSNAATSAGNVSFESTSGGTETGHSGDGYAKITPVSVTGNSATTTSKINQ